MKMGFAFMILLCTMQNAQSMSDALTSLKTERQSSGACESYQAPVDKNSLLIKACKCPTTTTSLIGFLMGNGADVNAVVNNTTALITAIETQDDNDSSIIHMLVPQATSKHKVLALKHAIEKEKWKTAALLQDEYGVVLSDDDIQEPSTFILAPAIAWARRKAAAAKAGISHAISNLKKINHNGGDNHGDDNDCDDDMTYADYQTGKPIDEAGMNIATLGGMPH